MKKIFTMTLFAAAAISFASAQSHNEKNIVWNDNNKVSKNYDQHSSFDKKNGIAYNENYFPYKEKQVKMEKINHEFDQKIASVKNNRRLNRWEKAKQIQWLQIERKNKISKMEYQYASSQKKTSGHDSHKW
ncbi:MAG: hypothetical protein Q8891_11065 [Bacteroidota bacterium]|nr:hypothetical protein [Bacteroidota bacterium]